VLSSAGGGSVTEAARRVMRKLMPTEVVALNMNWMGKRGKIGLSTMDLKNVIFGESAEK